MTRTKRKARARYFKKYFRLTRIPSAREESIFILNDSYC